MASITLRVSGGEVHIPGWVTDHNSFLRWLRTADIPDDIPVGFVNGDVWVEVMPERAFAHNRIKTAVAAVLRPLVRSEKLGIYVGDGMLFSSLEAGFTTAPDGMFVSKESIAAGRVRLTGAKEGEEDTKLIGYPDLTIEVVSDGSEVKDTEWLMSGYWNAGVTEYWVIDARKGTVRFTINRRGPKGYTAVKKSGGWVLSPVLGQAFRFVPGEMAFGRRDYEFETR
jgi:Uma2 family endonuclease